MTDVFLPILEMDESLMSAEICAERAQEMRQRDRSTERNFWDDRCNWHFANAIGWASRCGMIQPK